MITGEQIEQNFENLTSEEKEQLYQWLTPEIAVVINKIIPGVPFLQQVAANISNRIKG
jgi:hypothetical protein